MGPPISGGYDGEPKLLGITSRGPSQGKDDCSSYGIYTNILAHLGFIADATIEMRDYGWSD